MRARSLQAGLYKTLHAMLTFAPCRAARPRRGSPRLPKQRGSHVIGVAHARRLAGRRGVLRAGLPVVLAAVLVARHASRHLGRVAPADAAEDDVADVGPGPGGAGVPAPVPCDAPADGV